MGIPSQPTKEYIDNLNKKRNWYHWNIRDFKYDARTGEEIELTVRMRNGKPRRHSAATKEAILAMGPDKDGAYRMRNRLDGARIGQPRSRGGGR